jgi:hypothetical protein
MEAGLLGLPFSPAPGGGSWIRYPLHTRIAAIYAGFRGLGAEWGPTPEVFARSARGLAKSNLTPAVALALDRPRLRATLEPMYIVTEERKREPAVRLD